MNEELRKALEEVRNSIGANNTAALARLDQIEAAGKQRDAVVTALRTEIDAVKTTCEERDAQIKDMQQRARTQGMQREGVTDRIEALRILGMHCRAQLAGHLRKEVNPRFAGERKALDEFRARVIEADSGSGANTIPTLLSSTLFDSMEEVSELLGFVDFNAGMPGKMDVPVVTSRPTLRHKRATTITAMTSGTVGIGQVSFDPDEMYIYIPVDNRLLDMTAVDLGMLIYKVMREGAQGGLVTDLIQGDGTATYNSITGFLNCSTAAYVYNMPAGKKAFGDLTAEDMFAMTSKALGRGRSRGQYILSNDVLGLALNMDRTGKVPVVTYDMGGVKIWQKPVVIDEGMPTLADSAAGKAFLGFGDLNEYFVGLTYGMAIEASDQVLFDQNQTCFRLVLNGDIIRKGSAAFITGKTAAA